MAYFRTTQIFASVDAVFQAMLLLGYLGVLAWNDIYKNGTEKIFEEYGDWTMIAGLISALTALALDVFLLYFVIWNIKMAVYWWNYCCFILALQNWMAHLAVIYIGNGKPVSFPYVSLGIWAFMLLYSRFALMMISREDYLRMLEGEKNHSKKANQPTPKTQELQVDRPSSSSSSTVSATPTPTDSFHNVPSPSPLPPSYHQITPRRLDFKEQDVECRPIHHDKSSTTLCTALGTQADIDHYIARNEPVIHVNEEKDYSVELKTVM